MSLRNLLIRNIWNNRLEYIASEFVTSPIYPRLFSSFPPLIDRLSGRRMLSRSLHESLCCGKIHWQIASWKGNGVFEQPFDDSLFTWYPFIPRFVPINRDINVQSAFRYLIFDIKLRFMRPILYQVFFDTFNRSLLLIVYKFQLKFNLFQLNYVPKDYCRRLFSTYTISSSSYSPIRIQLLLSVDSSAEGSSLPSERSP